MRTDITSTAATNLSLIEWLFAMVFSVLGVFNLLLVHAVPGIFYFLLAVGYLPHTNRFLKTRLWYSIPLVLKVIVGIVVLWRTLAVGDLAEMAGL